jgi:multidrug efflux pump subunit AcrB
VVERVADQPTQVRHRVLDFGREFAIAVVAVILVTVLLLPLRVAAIAALAIPATVAVTVGGAARARHRAAPDLVRRASSWPSAWWSTTRS